MDIFFLRTTTSMLGVIRTEALGSRQILGQETLHPGGLDVLQGF